MRRMRWEKRCGGDGRGEGVVKVRKWWGRREEEGRWEEKKGIGEKGTSKIVWKILYSFVY